MYLYLVISCYIDFWLIKISSLVYGTPYLREADLLYCFLTWQSAVFFLPRSLVADLSPDVVSFSSAITAAWLPQYTACNCRYGVRSNLLDKLLQSQTISILIVTGLRPRNQPADPNIADWNANVFSGEDGVLQQSQERKRISAARDLDSECSDVFSCTIVVSFSDYFRLYLQTTIVYTYMFIHVRPSNWSLTWGCHVYTGRYIYAYCYIASVQA